MQLKKYKHRDNAQDFFKKYVGYPEDIYPEDILEFKPKVIEAMKEAKRISRDPNVKKYTDVKQMFKEILEDETEA